MQQLSVIFSLLMTFSGFWITKKKVNPISMFCGMWTIILFLSSLNLYGLKKCDTITYQFITIGIFSFCVGFLLVFLWRKRMSIVFVFSKKNVGNNKKETYEIRYFILYILGIISILYFSRKLPFVASSLLRGNALQLIRVMAQDSTSLLNSGDSAVVNAIRILIILPFSTAIIPITAIDFWMGKRNKRLMFICIFLILIRILTEGGRVYILYFAMHFLLGYIFSIKVEFNRNNVKSLKYKKKKFWRTLVLIIIVLLITSFSRAGERLVKNTYYYFSMQPYMFERWGEIVNEERLIGYGKASFNGFLFPVFYVLKNMLGIPFPEHWHSIYQMISATDSNWLVIAGDSIKANAYVSLFWFFYLDGRLLGMIIGGLIYGIIVANTYSSALNNTNVKTVCVYAMIFQSICLSFARFQFTSLYYVIALLYIILFAFKKITK